MKRIFLPYTLFAAAALFIFSCTHSKNEVVELEKAKLELNVADSNVVLPPAWAFGVLYGGYTNQEQTIATVKEIQQHDYPIDAYWIDSWFWSFDDHGRGPKKYIDFVDEL